MVEPLKLPTLTFDEPDVGVKLFLGDLTISGDKKFVPMNCTVKHRFSDFIVNEIDMSNEVCWYQAETDLQKWRPVKTPQ